ncbi:hypothetical protein OQA88_7337 [Cercophora sp. LCS_1]
MTFWKRLTTSVLVSAPVLSTVAHAKTEFTIGTDAAGVTRALALDRFPALYTGDFGDCLGGQSLFNITKFDAAYYADNLTIAFHIDGTTNIKNESLMMHIAVEAYGQTRYEMAFDPCFLNLYSLCPLNASVPITAWAKIPVGPAQIGGIPPIAFSIPDFEGIARVRIFANSTESEIGCFQASMRNGNTLGHPKAVAPVLGIFALVAIFASFATAIYGVSVVHMRMHYAHSLSAFVVFETFQSIFFTGALSVNWPSVCVAWWSNFAWSAGMIHTASLVRSVNSFAGVRGNASQVGGAGSVVLNTGGGGLFKEIYGRSPLAQYPNLVERSESIAKRAPYNASNPSDYTWAGHPVSPGMPLPGTSFGFGGTLAGVGIPTSDAFLVGLVWISVGFGLVVLFVAGLKASLEGLARMKKIKEDRLAYFRENWAGYLGHAALRAFFVAFIAVMTLAMLQFTIRASTGVLAITGIIFTLFLVGGVSFVAMACIARTRHGRLEISPDKVVVHRSRHGILIPIWATTVEEHKLNVRTAFTVSVLRIRHIDDNPKRESVHEDKDYVKKFAWFSARYRRSKWWFLAYYIVYLVGRAGFLGAGVVSPLVQVYGLLIFEILAFALIIILSPFEGARNTSLAVWMLSISKIASTGLSIAFLPEFKLDRIVATVIGVIIIVIQGLVIIALMILVVLSAITSWMSLTRNREELGAKSLEGIRVKYFENMEAKASDTFIEPKPKPDQKGKGKGKEKEGTTASPPRSGFSVMSVRREPKIEDEHSDNDVLYDLESARNGMTGWESSTLRGGHRISRSNSASSYRSVHSLPRGIRSHHSSWSRSSRESTQLSGIFDKPDDALAQRLSEIDAALQQGANRNASDSPPPEIPQRNSSRLSVRPNSGRNTPSRETLAKHAEERQYATPPPTTIPDIK